MNSVANEAGEYRLAGLRPGATPSAPETSGRHPTTGSEMDPLPIGNLGS
jgi:hypothetical protein